MILGAILLAFCCWAFTFGLEWGNFWIKIGLSVIILCLYSFRWQRPVVRFRYNSVMIGILSAAVLYGIFSLGNALSSYIIANAGYQIGGIYELGKGSNRVLIFLLLCFITGPGEEIFWRGFLQEKLIHQFGNSAGFILATLIYAGVHVFSMNLMLVFAALVAGAFWGGLYLWKKDLGLVIVSHALWSAFIFAVFPLR